MEFNIDKIRTLCRAVSPSITLHAAIRIEERHITAEDLISCIMTGEIIEEYPNDTPLPSCLICGNSVAGEVLHVVIGIDTESLLIITSYRPDEDKWSSFFTVRKER